jgi:protein SCO1/2
MYMNRARKFVRLLIRPQALASIAFAAALTTSYACVQAGAPVTIGGPWTLIAPDGATVTDQSYGGKWLLVFFGYTSCPNTCPTTLYEVAVALERLGPDAAEVQPLFITVDPQRDTPDVIGEYTRSFDSRIIGLTGDAEQIAAAAKEYGVYYVTHTYGAGAEDRVVDHSSYLYVMDPQGKFVRAFDADTPGDRIAAKLSELVGQSRVRTKEGVR